MSEFRSRYLRPVLYFLSGILLTLNVHANPTVPRPSVAYSGDQLMDMGVMTMNSKSYYDSGKMRVEMSGIPMVGEQVTVTREDLGLSWIINPGSKSYTENKLPKDHAQMFSGMEVLEYSQVGTDTIDGYPTRKFKAIFRDQQGNKGGGYFWFTEHNIPIKMDMVFKVNGQNQKMSMTTSNLQIGPQSAALFELPAGYKKGQAGMFGSLFGGGQVPADETKQDEGIPDTAQDAAKQGTEDAVNETVYEETKNAVSKGLKGLFGR